MSQPEFGARGDRFIAAEREKLNEIVRGIDKRLADFKALLRNSVDCKADYQPASLECVETLLMHLKPDLEEDADLLLDAALYIGETVRQSYKGRWDISDDDDNFPDYYGDPMITGHSRYEDFYPFAEIRNFIANPAPGYFQNLIREQIGPRP